MEDYIITNNTLTAHFDLSQMCILQEGNEYWLSYLIDRSYKGKDPEPSNGVLAITEDEAKEISEKSNIPWFVL